MIQLVPAAIAVFVASVVLAGLLRWGRMPADTPNARSLHRLPVPRGAGIAIWAGVAAATAWLPQGGTWLAPVALVIGVSLWDDYRGVPVAVRLAAQTLGALAWVGASLPWPLLLTVVLAIVWMANLYNFMDGADGLAGGMALFGFATYGAAAALAGDPVLSAICAALVAAAAAFLCFNFHPASLFMGDSGSVPIGFLAGALGLYGVFEHLWTPIFPLIAFFPFAFDATLTLFRRGLAGKRVWRAHREHLYQRAVLAGLGHRAMALRAYLLMVVCSVCAISVREGSPAAQALIMLAVLLCAWVVARRVDSLYRSRQPTS